MTPETTPVTRAPERQRMVRVSELLRADGRRTREGADVWEIMAELRATLASADATPFMRLFRGYTD